ncbi:MAG TPA: helix-turn-helix transcriptional regulator [Chloroflexota bacterium]
MAPQLKALRERVPMTQKELAEAAGVSRVTVARLEIGASSYPVTIRKLAKALGVKPSELMADA